MEGSSLLGVQKMSQHITNSSNKANKTSKSLSKRQILYAILREHGLDIKTSAFLSGYAHGAISHVYRNVERKRQQGLLSPLVPLAKRNARKILKGERIGEANPPKTSDIVAIIKEVFDRADPKIQHIEQRSLSAHIELTPEERHRYRQALGLPPVSQEPNEPQGGDISSQAQKDE